MLSCQPEALNVSLRLSMAEGLNLKGSWSESFLYSYETSLLQVLHTIHNKHETILLINRFISLSVN